MSTVVSKPRWAVRLSWLAVGVFALVEVARMVALAVFALSAPPLPGMEIVQSFAIPAVLLMFIARDGVVLGLLLGILWLFICIRHALRS